jgi:hypothetical protein
MRRHGVVAGAVVAGALSGVFAPAVWGASRRPSDVSALAVLHEHVAYESQLLDQALPRLTVSDRRTARAVLGLTSALDGQLARQLAQRGYSPAQAHALWQQVIGDGTPPPSRVLLYVCSIHATQSDRTELATAPPGTLGTLLGNIELTLLLEGRQLADGLGAGALAASQSQRASLHALAPMLIPTDQAYARAA